MDQGRASGAPGWARPPGRGPMRTAVRTPRPGDRPGLRPENPRHEEAVRPVQASDRWLAPSPWPLECPATTTRIKNAARPYGIGKPTLDPRRADLGLQLSGGRGKCGPSPVSYFDFFGESFRGGSLETLGVCRGALDPLI
jgi:hypothetical protein